MFGDIFFSFANNFWTSKDKELAMTLSCFSHSLASKNVFFTLKCQGQTLTSGQGHVVTKIGHVAYQSIRLNEPNTMKPSPAFYVFPIESYWQKYVCSLKWPRMTFQEAISKKDTLGVTGGPNSCDSEIFGLFLCLQTNLQAFSFFSIDL